MHSYFKRKFYLLAICVFISFTSYILPQPYKVLTIQGDGINVRQEATANSRVVLKLNTADRLDVLTIGNQETVSGKKDYWYQVKYQSKTGWVFGAFTSLRQEGRQTMTAKFTECSAGDIGHLVFTDEQGNNWDFGEGPNNLGNYELCIVPEGDWEPVGNSEYLNKTFQITYTVNKCSSYFEEEGLIDCPTIVELKLIQNNSEVNNSQQDLTNFLSSTFPEIGSISNIKELDLNHDKTSEVIVETDEPSYWIFLKTKAGYRPILKNAWSNGPFPEVLKTNSKGFNDLKISFAFHNAGTEVVYKFNGQEYIEYSRKEESLFK